MALLRCTLTAALLALSLLTAQSALAAPVVGDAFFVADPATSGPADLELSRGQTGFALGWVAEGTASARTLTDGASLMGAPTVLQVPEELVQPGSRTRRSTTGGMLLEPTGGGYVAGWHSTTVISQLGGSFPPFSNYRFANLDATGADIGAPTFTSLANPPIVELSGSLARRGSELAIAGWSRSIQSGTAPALLTVRFASSAAPSTLTVRSLPFADFVTVPQPIASAVALASNGDSYLLAWTEQTQLKLARVLATHTLEPVPTPSNWTLGPRGLLRASAQGSGFLIAWEDGSAPGIRAARVNADGTVLDATSIAVTTTAPRSLALASTGFTSLLVFGTGAGETATGLSGVRIATNGSVLDSPPFTITSGNIGSPAVAATGDDVWLVAYDDIAARTLIRARFVGSNGVPPAPTNPVPGSCAVSGAGSVGGWAWVVVLAAPLFLRRRRARRLRIATQRPKRLAQTTLLTATAATIASSSGCSADDSSVPSDSWTQLREPATQLDAACPTPDGGTEPLPSCIPSCIRALLEPCLPALDQCLFERQHDDWGLNSRDITCAPEVSWSSIEEVTRIPAQVTHTIQQNGRVCATEVELLNIGYPKYSRWYDANGTQVAVTVRYEFAPEVAGVWCTSASAPTPPFTDVLSCDVPRHRCAETIAGDCP